MTMSFRRTPEPRTPKVTRAMMGVDDDAAEPKAPFERKRNISKEIANPPKKQFDYLIIKQDGDMMFVVDGSMPAEKAAKVYLRHMPNAQVFDAYEPGFARFNVVTQAYEVCPEGKGTFRVHIFHMGV